MIATQPGLTRRLIFWLTGVENVGEHTVGTTGSGGARATQPSGLAPEP